MTEFMKLPPELYLRKFWLQIKYHEKGYAMRIFDEHIDDKLPKIHFKHQVQQKFIKNYVKVMKKYHPQKLNYSHLLYHEV